MILLPIDGDTVKPLKLRVAYKAEYGYIINMMKYILPALFLITGLLSCASNKAPDTRTPETDPDWPGVYTGVTPAADCPGIEVQLTLNSDGTFALQYQYIDRDVGVFSHEGTFTWDETGRIVILDIENYPPYYETASNRLIQLDMQGNRITGDLADLYVLKKVLTDD
jgi:uncharacterized lipoprotein NlpE involved in copper resistance